MGHRDVENARAAAALLRDDANLRKRIVALAYKVTGSRTEMRDLAQEAMARAIDPARSPWDPAKQPDLFLHIGSIVNTIIFNRRRAAGRHPEDAIEPEDDKHPGPVLPDRRPSVLQGMVREEDNARYEFWLEILTERLASDAPALDVHRLVCEGLEKPSQQAAKLKRPIEEIYAANRRLAYHIERVKEQYPDGRPSSVPSVPPVQKPGGAPEVEG